ncbi:MAG TPA: thiamine pyrophosphate-dependent enzyme [Pseudolabrys sp.]|nr:thiamine pyrophosphate-dependent enzyme [Pseudolabrys sp.]
MARKQSQPTFDRRAFLAGVGAATALTTGSAGAKGVPEIEAKPPKPSALRPSAAVAAAETGPVTIKSNGEGARPGSDFMVDVIRSVDMPYVVANVASSFRGLHESLLTYGGNKKPELIACTHEESSVGIAHGYFKVTGKPLVVLCHGTVGLQHAAMAIYNAWCDRVPVVIMGGNDLDASRRPPGVPTFHSGQDIGALVRDFTKWDDNPVSLNHFAESFVRAYKMSMTPPYEPVFLSLDAELQEEAARDPDKLRIPKFTPTAPPQGDSAAVREAAQLLVNAQNPVIVADRAARTPNGIKLLVDLAEALNAPVVNQGGRMNFPNTHYLNHTGRAVQLLGQADVVLGLELADFYGTVNAYIDNGEDLREPRTKPNAKLISISAMNFYSKSNYQDFQRYQPVDLSIAGDAEATLPALTEAVKSALSGERKAAIEKRADALKKAKEEARLRTLKAASYAWDASPISTARLCAEIWAQIKNEDWSLVAQSGNVSGWPNRLWKMERHYHHLGASGGYGVGYGLPAAVGGALANRDAGRFSVNIQADGDMMYAPGALWTAVRYKLPLLSVMHNNRAYHQEVMHVQRMADRRDRVLNDGPIGTLIDRPYIDYAKLAQSMGMVAFGPIEDPKELGPTLKKAVQLVKGGEPVLLDVVTQPR